MEIFIFLKLCVIVVLPVLSGRSSKLYGASFLSAYHRLNELMFWVALIVSAVAILCKEGIA